MAASPRVRVSAGKVLVGYAKAVLFAVAKMLETERQIARRALQGKGRLMH
jgi:predicted transcriptional regulator